MEVDDADIAPFLELVEVLRVIAPAALALAINAPTRTPRLNHSIVAGEVYDLDSHRVLYARNARHAHGAGLDDEAIDGRHEPRAARSGFSLDDAGLSHRIRRRRRAYCTAIWCSSPAAIRTSRNAFNRTERSRSKTRITLMTARRDESRSGRSVSGHARPRGAGCESGRQAHRRAGCSSIRRSFPIRGRERNGRYDFTDRCQR